MISTGYPGTSSTGCHSLRTLTSLAYRLLCVWVSVSCAGCLVLAAGAGGVAGAVYVMGKLKEEVNYPVPVVHDAAVAAMKDLGLKLEEDRADKLSAKMKSEF
ncbi:MAG TPA: DUF3568 family protein, partial [Nitrospira sp.]